MVNENKVLSYCDALRYIKKHNQNNEKVVLHYVEQTTHYHFKLDFQKVNQHTGGMWSTHGTKHRKDNQLHSQGLSMCLLLLQIVGVTNV